MISRLILTAWLLLPVSASALADDASKEPFELVRELRALQDETTRGGAATQTEVRQLGARIADQLIAASADVWNDAKNVRAAVIYTLGGGEPRVLRALFGVRALPGVEERLLNGALAYSEGRDADAAELLANTDVRTLEPLLAAHVALVQSALIGLKDVKRSTALLEEARLLAPGTLVEDAALRRQTFHAAASRDRDAFLALASIYMRRFPRSMYVGAFREQFATEVAGEGYGQEPESLAGLEAMLGTLDPANRQQFYLAVANHAVMKGRVELGRLATANAVASTREGSVEQARAKVYEGAILVVGEDQDTPVAALKSIDRAALEASDAELIDAALAVAAEVARPAGAFDGATLSHADLAASGEPGRALPLSRIVARAREVVAEVDTLLNEVSR